MSRRFRGLAVALVSVALAATASPALAKPPVKPGAASNLTLVPTWSDNAYAIAATWSPATNTTSYAVRLSAAGVTLESGSVTTASWTAHTTAAEGTLVTLSVTPYNGTRKGTTTSRNLPLPDLTAPQADYTVQNDAADSTVVTLTPLSRSNDVVTQVVDWGDGFQTTWGPATPTASHTYPAEEKRYTLTIKVTDDAGLWTDVEEFAVVMDEQAPQGEFAASAATAWASWTKVGVTQSDISDNWTPDENITRVIHWGDLTETTWAQGTNPKHVYAAAGSYMVTVVLTDEAGKSSGPIAASTVVVTADKAAPVVKLTLPKALKSVRAWRTLRGTATDAGVGVRGVQVKAIEKRGTAWYAYRATAKTWVKVGPKAGALRKATVMTVKPTATKTWSAGLARLTKGTLVYKVRGVDNRGNVSVWLTKKAVLTKR